MVEINPKKTTYRTHFLNVRITACKFYLDTNFEILNDINDLLNTGNQEITNEKLIEIGKI